MFEASSLNLTWKTILLGKMCWLNTKTLMLGYRKNNWKNSSVALHFRSVQHCRKEMFLHFSLLMLSDQKKMSLDSACPNNPWLTLLIKNSHGYKKSAFSILYNEKIINLFILIYMSEVQKSGLQKMHLYRAALLFFITQVLVKYQFILM